MAVGAPFPCRPPLVPGLAPRSVRALPWAAFDRATVSSGVQIGGHWKSGRAAPAWPRAMDTAPPTSNSDRSAPGGTATSAAQREPWWGVVVTGGGAGDHSSGGDQVRRRQFGSCSPGSARSEPAWSACAHSLEGGGTLPPSHAHSVSGLAPLTPRHPLTDHQTVAQSAFYQLPPHL